MRPTTPRRSTNIAIAMRLPPSKLNGKRSVGSHVWNALNSSFVLWLLSLVFVTVLGAAFTRYQAMQSELADNIRKAGRLDVEIEYRLNVYLLKLNRLSSAKQTKGKPTKEAAVKTLFQTLCRSPTNTADIASETLLPEFANMSLCALVAELHRSLHSSASQPVLGNDRPTHLADSITVRGVLSELLRASTDVGFVPSTPEGGADYIQSTVRLARWKQLYRQDCPVDSSRWC